MYNSDSQMDNLEFKRQILKYFPEDEKKMENMTLSDKIEFIKELKKLGRYTVVGEE